MAKIQRESLPNKIETLLSGGGQQEAPPCYREKTKRRHRISFSPGTGTFSPLHPMGEKINIWSSRKLMCPWGFEINLHCRRDLPLCEKSFIEESLASTFHLAVFLPKPAHTLFETKLSACYFNETMSPFMNELQLIPFYSICSYISIPVKELNRSPQRHLVTRCLQTT